jgi:hypothetical protein
MNLYNGEFLLSFFWWNPTSPPFFSLRRPCQAGDVHIVWKHPYAGNIIILLDQWIDTILNAQIILHNACCFMCGGDLALPTLYPIMLLCSAATILHESALIAMIPSHMIPAPIASSWLNVIVSPGSLWGPAVARSILCLRRLCRGVGSSGAIVILRRVLQVVGWPCVVANSLLLPEFRPRTCCCESDPIGTSSHPWVHRHCRGKTRKSENIAEGKVTNSFLHSKLVPPTGNSVCSSRVRYYTST